MHSHIYYPRIGISLDFRNSCSHDEAVRKGQAGAGGQRGTRGQRGYLWPEAEGMGSGRGGPLLVLSAIECHRCPLPSAGGGQSRICVRPPVSLSVSGYLSVCLCCGPGAKRWRGLAPRQ